MTSSSSAAKPGHMARLSRLSASSSSSPKSASVTGASIPAATPDAPAPGSSRSTTSTEAPACAARHAHDRPTMPAPITTRSWALLFTARGSKCSCLRRHYPDQVLRSAAASRPLSRSARLPLLACQSYPGRSARIAAVTTGSDRRARLARARLYFVTDAGAGPGVVRAALEGGADMVQLRDPALADADLLAAAAPLRALCDEHDALLWMNDRPDLALRCGADGVHLGQDDMPPADARELAGPELLIGLSTHSEAQFDAGIEAGADQLSVGPVWETPTKPGRPAAGLELCAARGRPAARDAVVRHRRDRRRERGPGGRGRCRAGGGGAGDPRCGRPPRRGLGAQGRAGRRQGWRSAIAASGASSASARRQARRRPLPSQRQTPRRARDRWRAATPAGGQRTTRPGPPSSPWPRASARWR